MPARGSALAGGEGGLLRKGTKTRTADQISGELDFVGGTLNADAVGVELIIAAVDSKGGHVVIHGWKTSLPLTALEAVPEPLLERPHQVGGERLAPPGIGRPRHGQNFRLARTP